MDVPRSISLALWLGASPVAPAALATARRAVGREDEPHVVQGLPTAGSTLDALLTDLGRLREVAAVLPVPGETGVPPQVAALALDAGEAVLALGAGDGWVAVPDVTAFGSELEPGYQVTWHVRPLPGPRRSLVAMLGSPAEARADLRAGIARAAAVLEELDVPAWREASTRPALAPAALGPVPGHCDPRALGDLTDALRMLDVVDAALADEGGALSSWQADQRRTALRELGRLARRAVAAASLAAARRGER